MSLEDFSPAELTPDVLDELCQESFGVPLNKLLQFAVILGQAQKLMEGDLHLKRFAGLTNGTTKENPVDCSYVRMCVIDWLRRPEQVQALFQGLKAAVEKV